MILEICIASVDDAIHAHENGADRVELCSALALGGLTPSLATVIEAREAVPIPIIAMARPRSGGFWYSRADFRVMQRDIELMLEQNVEGIAFGILREDGTIDLERCQRIVNLVGDRQAVFHRAFDVTPDPFVALEQMIDLGITRIMTSGQEESAYCGATRIAQLIQRAAGCIEILPAGGINRFTLQDVLTRTGCDQIHASLRMRNIDPSTSASPHVSFGGSIRLPEDRFDVTDADAVASLREMANKAD